MTSKLSPPPTQRTFANAWSELDYLCRKVHFWLHARQERARALIYRDRLERVLHSLPQSRAILREEGLSLLSELRGDLADSVKHRTREIELMERLHLEAQSKQYDKATRAYMLQGRDAAALAERRRLLDSLLHRLNPSNGAKAEPARLSEKGSPILTVSATARRRKKNRL